MRAESIAAERETVNPDQQAHRLVAGLHTPNPAIYWADLIATALAGWVSFLFGLWAEPFSPLQFAALAISVAALYRGLCFVHEISHLRSRVVKGFETAWNLLFGVPLLIPSFAYVGVHRYHHELATYGTEQDPEYLPFSRSHWMTIVFTIHSLLIPAALLFRFFVVAPLALLLPPLRVWRIRHASSLTMNLAFRREVTSDLSRRVALWEAIILMIWGIAGLGAWQAGVAGKALAAWYVVTALAALVNTLRALAAHRYETDGAPRDRAGQLADSIDVPGGWLTELWAPVGLRYHALHHYFPGIPYHNLGAAHRALIAGLPSDALYRRQASPSLMHSLAGLLARGRSAMRNGS